MTGPRVPKRQNSTVAGRSRADTHDRQRRSTENSVPLSAYVVGVILFLSMIAAIVTEPRKAKDADSKPARTEAPPAAQDKKAWVKQIVGNWKATHQRHGKRDSVLVPVSGRNSLTYEASGKFREIIDDYHDISGTWKCDFLGNLDTTYKDADGDEHTAWYTVRLEGDQLHLFSEGDEKWETLYRRN